jgi:hypothetical protein
MAPTWNGQTVPHIGSSHPGHRYLERDSFISYFWCYEVQYMYNCTYIDYSLDTYLKR